MVENVINVIQADFNAQADGGTPATIDAFCLFAKEWLQKKCVVGVGQTVEGFSLRFANGDELLLTANAPLEFSGTAVSIGGIAGRGDRVKVDNTSVNITGR